MVISRIYMHTTLVIIRIYMHTTLVMSRIYMHRNIGTLSRINNVGKIHPVYIIFFS